MRWKLAAFASGPRKKGLPLKKLNVLQRIQFQGRQGVAKFALSILFALLAVTLLTTTMTSQAHAAASSHVYKIVPGDTLSGIAHRFGVSISSLVAANHIANPNLIYAGNTLAIPGSGSGGSVNTPVTKAPPQVHGSYADMIREVFGPYGDGAVHVAMCESSMNPQAYNGVLGAAGLFQIIPGTFASTSYRGQSVYNPIVNIKAAHEIFVRDGYTWREWTCKP